MQRHTEKHMNPLRAKPVRRVLASTVVVCLLVGFGIGVWVGQWLGSGCSKGLSTMRGLPAPVTRQVVDDVSSRGGAASVAPHTAGPQDTPQTTASPPTAQQHRDLPSSYQAFLSSIRFPPDALLDFANHSSGDINLYLHQRAAQPSVATGGAAATLFLIPVNDGYLDFGLNLMCSLLNVSQHRDGDAAVGLSSPHQGFVFVAMDTPAHAQLAAMGLPVMRDPDVPFITSKSAAWADPKFHSLVCTKLIPVLRALRQGIRVVLSDADVVFLQNPLPYFRRDASLTFSIGSCHKDIRDNFRFTVDGIEKLNTGFYVADPTAAVERLFSTALETCRGSSLTGDQPAINAAIQADWTAGVLPLRGGVGSNAKPDLEHGYSYAFFDGCLFANGCVYFKHLCENTTKYPLHLQRAYEATGVSSLLSVPRNGRPVMVHANFLVGKKNKIRHLTKYGLWDAACIDHWRGRAR